MNLVLETCNPFNADTGYYAEQKVFDLTFFLFGILVKAWWNEVNLSETENAITPFAYPFTELYSKGSHSPSSGS